jgi:DNA-binding CsgD family transcriptional regulator
VRLSWPSVGRTEEMRTIESAIASVDTRGVLVFGPEGVGKTRIVRDALVAAASRGCECRWVVATSSARHIPLGAFTEWTPSGVADTMSLLRGVIAAVTASPSGAPVVLGVDDVHLLDDLSTFVVQQIVQRGAAKVVLTLRDGEAVPAAVQEVWKAGQFDRLDVQPLSSEDTAALLSATMGAAVDPDAAGRLWQLTQGNALYLRNIVEREVADGRFAPQHGYWRWTGDPVIPPGLAELIEARIGALPEPVAEVIDTLAVGEPIELAALRRIADPAAIEDADIRGLITVESTGGIAQVRVAHPLYGEVRRRRSPATRLRRLRGRIAADLAESEDRDDPRVAVRRAALSLDSDLAPDTDLLIRAAHASVWLADLPLADRLCAAAIRAGAGPEPNFVRAHVLSWLGRGGEADAVLAGIDPTQLTAGEFARRAFLRASNILWALGDPVGAKSVIDDASRTVAPEARSYIDAFLAVYWFAMDRPDAAFSASESLALDSLPAVVGAEIAWVLAAIAADGGRTADAVALAESGYVIGVRSLDAPHMRFNIADAHVSALLLAGRTSDALVLADRMRRQAADLPGAAQLLGTAVAGRTALAAGRLGDGSVLLKQAADGLSAAGYVTGWGYRYRVPHITALAMRGCADEAAAALAVLDGVRRPFRLLDYERSLARGWLAAAQGAVTEAISVVRAAAERASAKGQFAAEVLCLQTAAQFGDRTCARRLSALASIVEGPRAGLAARFAAALRDGYPDELASVSMEFEDMGDVVAAVDVAAHAALVYRRQDKRGSALGCVTRAEELAERCGGVCTPALREATEPLPLTAREREIVMLIADGLSNRGVAERLTLSVRTVESHIYRAMSKTGTATREELAAVLSRRTHSAN